MVSSGQLINHCGARPVTKGDLELMPAPPKTDTWYPIRHIDVLDAVEVTIASAGFSIRACSFSVSQGNQRFFGVLDLMSQLAAGVSLSVGIRNSNDKTFPIGFCIGNRTFVCDNLAFSAEIVIAKKHTRFGEDRFREGIATAVGKLPDYSRAEAQRIEQMQQRLLTEEQADAVFLRSWEKGIVGLRMLRPLIDEWRHPTYPDFEPRSAWSLLAAYTHIAKGRQKAYPNKAALEVMQFQTLLAA